uniref:Uncharacterized protein n=1 Tax=Anguilla anguilla TaxID=7936 RepID=A0A0E9WWR9_ANGAN
MVSHSYTFLQQQMEASFQHTKVFLPLQAVIVLNKAGTQGREANQMQIKLRNDNQ